MANLVRRASSRHPDLFDWLDMPWAPLPFAAGRGFRVEEFATDGTYVVRAELPGLDPDKDIEVTVDAGVLTIRAEREEEHKEARRSEFRYGSLTRSVTLPAGADAEHVTAAYNQGILEVSVPVTEAGAKSHRVAIKKGG